MNGLRIDIGAIRDQLRVERNRLFKRFVRNPANTRLAIDIRLIDDQIAELSEVTLTDPLRKKPPVGPSCLGAV